MNNYLYKSNEISIMPGIYLYKKDANNDEDPPNNNNNNNNRKRKSQRLIENKKNKKFKNDEEIVNLLIKIEWNQIIMIVMKKILNVIIHFVIMKNLQRKN